MQFNLKEFDITVRRDSDKHGGGLIEFLRKGVVSQRLNENEPKSSEYICSEITFSKEKWICSMIYQPPAAADTDSFFEEMTIAINKAVNKHQNFLIKGDFRLISIAQVLIKKIRIFWGFF